MLDQHRQREKATSLTPVAVKFYVLGSIVIRSQRRRKNEIDAILSLKRKRLCLGYLFQVLSRRREKNQMRFDNKTRLA